MVDIMSMLMPVRTRVPLSGCAVGRGEVAERALLVSWLVCGICRLCLLSGRPDG